MVEEPGKNNGNPAADIAYLLASFSAIQELKLVLSFTA